MFNRLIELANQLDKFGCYKTANDIDSIIRMTNNSVTDDSTENLLYHYAETNNDLNNMKKNGILSPHKLLNTKYFKYVYDNYLYRAQNFLKKKNISDENILDYLNNSRGEFCKAEKCGEKMIFALFNKIHSGISKEHNNFLKKPCIGIDYIKLIKNEDVSFYVVEWPGKKEAFEIMSNNIKELKTTDWLATLYNKNDDLLFGGIPHCGIVTKNGVISPKYLIFE